MNYRVMFYVQHLWGVGHVYRATRIAHGMRAASFDVHLIWGGTEVPGFDFSGMEIHRLAPVRSGDATFSRLLHADGREFTQDDQADRAQELLNIYRKTRPDILMTEAYPFGRRQMRFELLPLIEEASNAHSRPMIVSSIRDIMQEGRKAKRVEESCKLVGDFFDLVLVHGDPDFIQIEETLQGAETFQDKVRYTGLVTPPDSGNPAPDKKEHQVLVSVGGGAFGRELLDCAIEAARLQTKTNNKWLISCGSELPDNDFQHLVKSAPSHVKIVKHIPDMVAAMQNAEVSISHAGYNTVADILRSGCKAILFPYTGGRETEQLRRAKKLDELGVSMMIEPGNLSPETIASALDTAQSGKFRAQPFDLDGAARTAQILDVEYKNWHGGK